MAGYDYDGEGSYDTSDYLMDEQIYQEIMGDCERDSRICVNGGTFYFSRSGCRECADYSHTYPMVPV